MPDGCGGFYEIFDDGGQGGMFAVNSVAAQTLQDCLDGNAAPFDESNMMFADGIQLQEVVQCVTQSPTALSKTEYEILNQPRCIC